MQANLATYDQPEASIEMCFAILQWLWERCGVVEDIPFVQRALIIAVSNSAKYILITNVLLSPEILLKHEPDLQPSPFKHAARSCHILSSKTSCDAKFGGGWLEHK